MNKITLGSLLLNIVLANVLGLLGGLYWHEHTLNTTHTAHRDSVKQVEDFIGKTRPKLDPALRRGYAEFLVEAAHEFDIPTKLLATVGYAESRFLHTATGDGGKSHGMFQVQGFWANEIPFLNGQRANLYRSDLNIRAGAWILRHYAGECGDDWYKMLACYNGGPRQIGESKMYAAKIIGRL